MAATATLTGQQAIDYITSSAQQRNLDPNAVLAVAQQEGLGGGIGDNGTSFGPWQLHVGSAFPSSVNGTSTASWSTDQKQAWAWSPAGIDYALSRIQGVAAGLQGTAAVTNIVTLFERPRNPSAEIQGALGSYSRLAGGGVATAPGTSAGSPAAATSPAGFFPSDPASTLGGIFSQGIQDLFKGNLTSLPAQVASSFLTPLKWIGKLFETIYTFLTNGLLQYLLRLGLIGGGGLLFVIGFRLVSNGGLT